MSDATKLVEAKTKELAAAMAETLLRNLAILIDEASGKIDIMRGGHIRHERGVPVRDTENMLRACANNLAVMGYEAASELFDEAIEIGRQEAQDKLHAAAEALASIANTDTDFMVGDDGADEIRKAKTIAKETLLKLGY